MATEEPSNGAEPLGEKALSWIATKTKQAAKGTWNMGLNIATNILSEAALRYYGLK